MVERSKPARTMERRVVMSEIMITPQRMIEGYAAMFGKRSADLGGFVEEVAPTAFTKTVKEADVRALINHDPNMPLGRSSAGTLELSIDSTGLHYRINPPDTSYARDLMVSMERGDVNQSSFAFYTINDNWEATTNDQLLRTLIEVKLVDVSTVTYPAYPDATSGITENSAVLASLQKRCGAIDLSDRAAVLSALGGEQSTEDAEPVLTSDVDERQERAHRLKTKWAEFLATFE